MSAPVLDESLTIGAARRHLTSRLRAAWGGATDNTAALDARILLARATGMGPGELALNDHEPIEPLALAKAVALVERRMDGEPVARIVEEKEFWSLRLKLTSSTLVPRPDTESLVAAALDRINAAGRQRDRLRLLDLGTGSGCILLALLSALPDAIGFGVDRSADATATARENAVRLGVSDRAHFFTGNWVEALGGRFDAILANPPYVNEGHLPDLPVEVIGHDPRMALDGGADGLVAYRAIIPELPRLLNADGFAILEFGPRQAEPILAMANNRDLDGSVGHDLSGRERFVVLTSAQPRPGIAQKQLGKRIRSD